MAEGSRGKNEAAILMMLLVPYETKRTILSNRIRIHVSIRNAIVILNSKLPTLCVCIKIAMEEKHGKL